MPLLVDNRDCGPVQRARTSAWRVIPHWRRLKPVAHQFDEGIATEERLSKLYRDSFCIQHGQSTAEL